MRSLILCCRVLDSCKQLSSESELIPSTSTELALTLDLTAADRTLSNLNFVELEGQLPCWPQKWQELGILTQHCTAQGSKLGQTNQLHPASVDV